MIRPGDRARHDQDRVGHALGDNAVDFGVGFSEQAHRIPPGPHIAFGRLLVGDRLFQILLRDGLVV